MEKPALADHEIHDLLARRYSPRAFVDRALEPEQIASLLEAARWAPSCFNGQPWRYVVAPRQDADAFAALASCLGDNNRRWASNAALLLLSVARLRFEHNDKPNRHALHDVGLASAMLTVQATSMGLGVHQMAGFSVDKSREVFSIPDGFEPVAVLAVGYFGEPDALPHELAERERAPRSRKPQAEFAFTARWETPWSAP